MRLPKVLSASLILVSLGFPAWGEDARQPVPDAAKLKEAKKLMNEVFEEDYAKLKPKDRAALVKKLLRQADDAKDDLPAKYVLWQEASTIAAQMADMDTALTVLDKMAATFAVDVVPLKKTALASVAASARDPDLRRIAGVMKTLLDAPDDAPANLLVGRYLCFTEGDWEKGLPLLAKCSDAALKALAVKELAQPADGAAEMSVADGWWDFAKKEDDNSRKAAAQMRAKQWYEKALPSLASLTKAKAQMRIAEIGASSVLAGEDKIRTGWPLGDGKETVAGYAKRASLEPTQTLDLGGGVKMEFVLVPPGQFMMGSDEAEARPHEKPVHRVTISRPYYIGKYDVTVAQFRRFAETAKYETECERGGNKGWTVKDGKWQGDVAGINWKQPGFEQTPEHPVVLVTWNDAQAFTAWLSKLSDRDIRLLTEAQWEYAARGPGSPKYPWSDKWDGTKANHGDVSLKNTGFTQWGCTSDNDGYAYTSPVGVYKNASWCGAYDMAGNVCQWCADWFDDKYYQNSPTVDPKGPASGGDRVLRGSSWSVSPDYCRAALRHRSSPGNRDAIIGFRVAAWPAKREPEPAAKREAAAPAQLLPAGASPFAGHHYKLFVEPVTWDEAAQRCAQLGGHLVCITSVEKQNFLYGMIRRNPIALNIWLGGTSTSGNVKWCSGEAATYTNWRDGRPDRQSAGVSYLNMLVCEKWGYKGVWDERGSGLDTNPDWKQGYVCEWDY